ncbi:Aryl-phospho-beta-D-glucosidase BglC, GH1 family [Paenibacillus sp. yr247]|uniref:cellulase family glycosylhydrolase n=1 Tax=Paenibacillus sp. yr247 TaxID=1761880 RepID=UPI00089207C4|nr:cellulase family glycosylhydrolase [Paenibacillus sp. yr247]SDO76282.1 Aryl-phospho-beta-D-glucosidase BglC, GH1 family [Paenibacillus sp. yr247]
MKRKMLFVLLSFVILTGLLFSVSPQNVANAAFGSSDFLKTNGKVIKNNSGTGAIVNLRGPNLGGWLLQEAWMSPMNTPDQFTLTQTLWNRFGTDLNHSLQGGYHDVWIQASDLDNIKNMGLNVVRVPMYWEDFMNPDGSMKPDSISFRSLDWLVTESALRNIYVILDFHGIQGGDCPWQSCGISNSNQLWVNTTYQDRTVQIWERIATHYNGNPTIAAYDLMNEPLLTSGAAENASQVQQKYNYYNRLYNAVRAKDPDHIVIVAAFFDWEQSLPPSTYGWTNVVYETHHYNFTNFNDWNLTNSMIDNWLSKMAQYQTSYNVPVYAGEFAFGQLDLIDKWLAGLNGLNASWSNWSYKVTGGGNWGYYNNNTNLVPDIYNDSTATITSKWSKFATSFFQANTGFINVVMKYSGQAPTATSSIKALANNQFVTAENAGASPLVANRTTVGDWEKFTVINNSDGTVSFLSKANNNYVTADLNQSTKLIARATTIQAWEKFRIIDRGSGKVALQAVANNKYVSADLNLGAVLYANRDVVSGWEEFIIAFAP